MIFFAGFVIGFVALACLTASQPPARHVSADSFRFTGNGGFGVCDRVENVKQNKQNAAKYRDLIAIII
jgi:hypothetical protein